jgi:outer membrane protein TolC
MRLANMRTFITGAADGLGLAIAKAFAAEGARLFLLDVNARQLEVTVKSLQEQGAAVSSYAGSVASAADVTAAYLSLRTAFRTVQLQEQNARKAREELTFAEERYRVGAAIFLDVTTARVAYERAESDRINAIYDYHKAFAVLESAVGRPLR